MHRLIPPTSASFCVSLAIPPIRKPSAAPSRTLDTTAQTSVRLCVPSKLFLLFDMRTHSRIRLCSRALFDGILYKSFCSVHPLYHPRKLDTAAPTRDSTSEPFQAYTFFLLLIPRAARISLDFTHGATKDIKYEEHRRDHL